MFDRWDIELWSAKSRRKEVCGIFGCQLRPILECPHCGQYYCKEHAVVISIPKAHGEPGAFVLTNKITNEKIVMSPKTLANLIDQAGEGVVERHFTIEWVILTEEERKLAEEIKKELEHSR